MDVNLHVQIGAVIRGFQGVKHCRLVADDGEIAFQSPLVDRNLATAGLETDAGDGSLPAAGAERVSADFIFLRSNHTFC